MTHETPLKAILTSCIDEPQTIQQLSAAHNIPYQTIYHYVRRNTNKGFFSVKKELGFLWVRALITPARIDLIKGMQNSNKVQNPKMAQLPLKCTNERITAARQTMRRIDIKPVKNYCTRLFKEYVEKTANKKLIFIPDPDKDFFGQPLMLDYITRFNDMGRKVEELKKLEHCWNNSAVRYKNAVMLTLTFDPKLQESLWQCNKDAPGKFNKLMSYFTRKLGYRPEYINVFEYQKNGRIHFHVLFFGLKWLVDKTTLSQLWHKYGAGEIVDFLTLRNSGNKWIWDRHKPKDANNKNPEDYLKKYLKKGIFDTSKLYQYWIYNNRFFTNSRWLNMLCKYKTSSGFYVFIGSIDWEWEDEKRWEIEEMFDNPYIENNE